MITDEHITQYQELYLQRFGKELSREDARDQGTKLVRLMQLIYKPMTQEELNETLNTKKEIEELLNNK